MASVNIDSKAFKDPRFRVLAKRSGLTWQDCLLRVAQLWEYCTEHETYFLSKEILELIVECDRFAEFMCDDGVRLGEVTVAGIYIKGTRGRIEWLHKKRKGNKKGGLIRSKKSKRNQQGKFVIDHPASNPAIAGDASPAPHPGQSSAITTAIAIATATATAIAPVIAIAKETTLSHAKEISRQVSEIGTPLKNETSDLIAVYCQSFKSRYKANPPIGGKDAGIAKRLVKDLGIAKASTIVDHYLKMNEAYFLTKRHDLGTLSMNLNAVVVHLETGRSVTRFDAQSADSQQYHINQMRRIEDGEI